MSKLSPLSSSTLLIIGQLIFNPFQDHQSHWKSNPTIITNSFKVRIILNNINCSPQQRKLVGGVFAVAFYYLGEVFEGELGHGLHNGLLQN